MRLLRKIVSLKRHVKEAQKFVTVDFAQQCSSQAEFHVSIFPGLPERISL